MEFDKDGIKLLKLGFKLYSNVYKWIFLSQIFVLFVISMYSEKPELFQFGYEMGFFFLPISSSVIVGFVIHFLTSHLDSVKNTINSYRLLERYFEGVRRSVRNVFISLSSEKKLALEFDFYSINLDKSLKVEFLKIENYNEKVKAYGGVNLWHEATKKDVLNQFYNDMKNRYKVEYLEIDPLIKRRYMEVIILLEESIMPYYKEKEFAIKNFYAVISPSIQLLAQANKLLAKDYLFKESMSWYSNPPKLGGTSKSTLTIYL